MIIKEIYDKYFEGLDIQNPTEFQKQRYENQFLNLDISICGEIKDVLSNKTIITSSHVTGYYSKGLDNYFTDLQYVHVEGYLNCTNSKCNLSSFNKGDLIECQGRIKELKFSKTINDYNTSFWVRFIIIPSEINKINTLWLDPAYYNIKKDISFPQVVSNTKGHSTSSSGCSTILALFVVITLLFFILEKL